MQKMITTFAFILILLIPALAQSPEATEDSPQLAEIIMPISIYLLVDDIDSPNPDISTNRTEDDLRIILDDMNIIWSQANIELSLSYVGYVEVSTEILEDIIAGEFTSFFTAVNDGTLELPNISQLNGFYAKDIGGPNGITLSSQVYFVNDTPTVNDERVSSHEVGHMFGLHHDLVNPGHLMYSGTNGTALTEEEIVVSRYFAQGFLQNLRLR